MDENGHLSIKCNSIIYNVTGISALRFLYVTQRYTAFIVPGTLSVYTEQSSDIHEKRDFAYHVPWLGDLVEI